MIEIDGVRNQLHRPIWESGDYISDEYLTLINLSTSPSRSLRDAERIASAIRRLNRNLDTTSVLLVGTELAQPYNDVVAQLNDINVSIVGIEVLQPLNEDESRFRGASGSFKWAA